MELEIVISPWKPILKTTALIITIILGVLLGMFFSIVIKELERHLL